MRAPLVPFLQYYTTVLCIIIQHCYLHIINTFWQCQDFGFLHRVCFLGPWTLKMPLCVSHTQWSDLQLLGGPMAATRSLAKATNVFSFLFLFHENHTHTVCHVTRHVTLDSWCVRAKNAPPATTQCNTQMNPGAALAKEICKRAKKRKKKKKTASGWRPACHANQGSSQWLHD